MRFHSIIYIKAVLFLLVLILPIYSFKINKLSHIKHRLAMPVYTINAHVELACGDANIASKMLINAMDMEIQDKSGLSTGKHT